MEGVTLIKTRTFVPVNPAGLRGRMAKAPLTHPAAGILFPTSYEDDF